MNGPLLRGFADPVADAGDAFRSVLQALSRPGTVQAVQSPGEHPSGISAAAAAVLLALCDHTTPVWLDPAFNDDSLGSYLRFHSSAGVAERSDAATFALIGRDANAFDPSTFAQGTHEYPDRSTTVVVDVAAIGAGETVRLSGPGIDGSHTFGVDGAPQGFWPAMIRNNARFPLGIDTILTAGAAVAAIPRSTRIEVL